MNDAVQNAQRKERQRPQQNDSAAEATVDSASATPASTTLVQLSDARKVEVLTDALQRLLERHKAMDTDPAFVDAQRALNVVIHGVKPAA